MTGEYYYGGVEKFPSLAFVRALRIKQNANGVGLLLFCIEMCQSSSSPSSSFCHHAVASSVSFARMEVNYSFMFTNRKLYGWQKAMNKMLTRLRVVGGFVVSDDVPGAKTLRFNLWRIRSFRCFSGHTARDLIRL